MTPRISQYLNRTVLVSIPTLFEDGACHAYKLLGVEIQGLWLQSKELIRRLSSQDTKDSESLEPVVFVPFAQIAGLMLATRLPNVPKRDVKPPVAPDTRSRPKVEPPSAESRVKRKR